MLRQHVILEYTPETFLKPVNFGKDVDGTLIPNKIGWPTLEERYVEKGGRQKPKQQMEVFIKALYTFENQWFYSRQ